MVNLTITGKEIKATDAIKSYAEKKMVRVEKYFENENIDATVTIKKDNPQKEIAEFYVVARGNSYKAVTEDKDLYAAIDKDIDILEGQIRKTKAKRERMQKGGSSIKQLNLSNAANNDEVEDEVLKYMYYDVKPISLEDAKIKLANKKDNVFLTFVNVDTGKTNVIFKLKDSKNFGLIEPEN